MANAASVNSRTERMTPVAFGVQVAQSNLLGLAAEDLGDAAGHLAGDKVLAAPWRLVIEQDPAAGEQLVGLAIVNRHPVGVELGGRVRASRMERRSLALGRRREAEHLRG